MPLAAVSSLLKPALSAYCRTTTGLTIDRFNEAFNQQDTDTLASLLTDDTGFEDTFSPPDGRRIASKALLLFR
jgi:hypothetical protein